MKWRNKNIRQEEQFDIRVINPDIKLIWICNLVFTLITILKIIFRDFCQGKSSADKVEMLLKKEFPL